MVSFSNLDLNYYIILTKLDVEMKNYYYFSFMVENQSELGKFYLAVKLRIAAGKETLFLELKEVLHSSKTQQYVYYYRMFISYILESFLFKTIYMTIKHISGVLLRILQ